MSNAIDRRMLLTAAGAALVGSAVGSLPNVLRARAEHSRTDRMVIPYSELIAGEKRAWNDMLYAFVDPNQQPNPVNRFRIRPVGGDAATWGLTHLATDPAKSIPEPADHIGPLWMMQQTHNVLYWRAKESRFCPTKTADPDAKRMVAMQWEHVLLGLGNGNRAAGLSAMADGTSGINAEDDGSWKVEYLEQVVQILGDQNAIKCLEGAISGVLKRFKDTTPGVTQVDAGSGVFHSPLGLQYDETGDAGNGQSSTYEAPMMCAAVTLREHTRLGSYLKYAVAGSNWFDKSLRQRGPGQAQCLVRGIVLDPSKYGGAPRGTPINGDYTPERGALDNGYAKPQRFGRANYLLDGNMAAAVLNARLYRVLGDRRYLSRALGIVAAIAQPDTAGGMVITQDVTIPGCFSNGDPWVDGGWAPVFVEECLTLPGADPTGVCAAAVSATAAAIIASRSGGFYSADWSGSRLSPAIDGLLNGYKSFQARWDANPTGGKEAGRRQSMTSTSSVSMVQAAALIASWRR